MRVVKMMVRWKTVARECPRCGSIRPKEVLEHIYLCKKYKTVWKVKCRGCENIFTFVCDRSWMAELRHKYGLTRHEESIIRRQVVQPIIKLMVVSGESPSDDILNSAREEMYHLGGVAKMLRDL